LIATVLDSLISCILDACAREESIDPRALQLLLRRLSATGRPDLAGPLGDALARALDRLANESPDQDGDRWLTLVSEAASMSDDARLGRAACALLPHVRNGWSSGMVDRAMRSIDASFGALGVAGSPGLAAAAVDALERVVAGGYRPGDGMAHEVGAPRFAAGDLTDHVSSASALLAAYALTDRLPYAMLADELMQYTIRCADRYAGASFADRCDEARVFCRLGVLHRNDDYRASAVMSAGVDYVSEAARRLALLEPKVEAHGVAAAPFGLALAEWLNLQ
jgi:hypothetical protein